MMIGTLLDELPQGRTEKKNKTQGKATASTYLHARWQADAWSMEEGQKQARPGKGCDESCFPRLVKKKKKKMKIRYVQNRRTKKGYIQLFKLAYEKKGK